MSAFCEQCGAALGEGASFCAACGTKVPAVTTSGEPSVAETAEGRAATEPPSVSKPSTAQRPLPFPPPREPTASSAPTAVQAPGDVDRKPRRRWPYVVAAAILIAIVIGIITAASTGSKNAGTPAVHKCSYYPKSEPRPQTCISSLANAPCLDYNKGSKPNDCLSTAQVAAQKRAKKRAVARAKAEAKAAAVAAKRAAARAKRIAKERAAARAAANAWHRGYHEQSGSVFWKWSNSGSCRDYAQYGCWQVVVITKYGCPRYVAVNANEYQHGAIIGQLLDNQGYGIPPKTPRVFELDADTGGNVTAGNVSIDCE
jgi:zinc-ribbon domain